MWGIARSSPERTKARRFEELALPHLDAAYNLARWLTRDPHDAEDMVQEACVRAFKYFGNFHGEDARGWLLAIVRNTCYTWLQSHRSQEPSVPFDEEIHTIEGHGSITASLSSGNPESLWLQDADQRLINQALEKLPLEFREVLVLREIEDLSYKEIAAVAGIPIGTVMSRLARGRKLLGEYLKQMDERS